MINKVILVDQNDSIVGFEDKIKVHETGQLHRAFSIFIFNNNKELLIQQRALDKYHTAGLWSNTCCSHPIPEMSTSKYAKLRLKEEMGFSCNLKEVNKIKYKFKLNNDLWEHELDHIFIGTFNGEIKPNPEEVYDYRWIGCESLIKEFNNNSFIYTPWFKLIVNQSLKLS